MRRIPPAFRTPVALAVVVVIGLAAALAVLAAAVLANGGTGFPLDDAWIHMQFARVFSETGSFSYSPGEEPTAGSTSPLFTLLLAGFFALGLDGAVAGYALGILFLLAAAVAVFRLAKIEFGENLLLAGVAGLLTALEPRLIWAALSGMETTLFAALLLWSVLFYRRRQAVPLGIAAGLSVWARPEGVLLIPLLAFDAAYRRLAEGDPARKTRRRPAEPSAWHRRVWLPLVPLLAVYAGFNLVLSGSLLPNTYAAKTAYYAGGGGDFPAQVVSFLAAGQRSIIGVFAMIGALAALLSVLKRRPEPLLPVLLIPLALCLAYWYRLPFLYQEGRYLMPMLPFVVLLAVRGVSTVAGLLASHLPALRRKSLRVVPVAALGALLLIQEGIAAYRIAPEYAFACRYIGERQVRTAQWLAGHLPPDAVVGTHDIGAVGFHSGRRVADMVGLVSPAMIPSIGSFDGLKRFLMKEKVTHLAVLRNWFEIDNQRVLFRTDEAAPEVMEVMEFDPRTVHFVPQNVTRMLDAASEALVRGNPEPASRAVQQALAIDSRSSRAHLLAARLLAAAGRHAEAIEQARIAARLRPSYEDAERLLATLAAPGAGEGAR